MFSGCTNICEVGVGTGNVIGLLYNLGYKNFTGVDISPKMMKIAKQKIPGLITIEQDLREANYSEFDWVIAVGSLYNRISLKDKKELFLKMYNEMAEGALFFVSLRIYKYNYDFENDKIISGEEIQHNRFVLNYTHEWISYDSYYGVGHYLDLKTNQSFEYAYKTHVISGQNLINLVCDAGFKHIATGAPEDTGYYANTWVFQK